MAWSLGKSKSLFHSFTSLIVALSGVARADSLTPALRSLTETVREDVGFIKASPYFKNDLKILGYIFDLTKGTLSEVTPK